MKWERIFLNFDWRFTIVQQWVREGCIVQEIVPWGLLIKDFFGQKSLHRQAGCGIIRLTVLFEQRLSSNAEGEGIFAYPLSIYLVKLYLRIRRRKIWGENN